MVSRLRSTTMTGLFVALLVALTSVGVVALPAMGATNLTTVSITSDSPTAHRLVAGNCAGIGPRSHYTALKYTTKGVGRLTLDFKVKTTATVTATLYQGAYLPDSPIANCYIHPWNQPAGSSITSQTVYDNSGFPAFPEQTWILVLASDNPGAGVSAEVGVTTNFGELSYQSTTPTVTTQVLPPADYGQNYRATVSAEGGTAPYTFTATGLPPGLAISGGGAITGIPRVAGPATVTVAVRDSAGATSTRQLTLQVSPGVLRVSPAALASATAGVAYGQALSVTGGIAPYTFSPLSGNSPQGMTLTPDGIFSGVPAAAGNFTFGVSAIDAGGQTVAHSYTLTVEPPSIVMTPAVLPTLQVGVAASVSFTASGGFAPYAFAVTGGTLPAGLTLNSAGALTGTPTEPGSYDFTVTAADSTPGQSGNTFRRYAGEILPVPLSIRPDTLPNAAPGQMYSQTIAASGGFGNFSYAVTAGSLPSGVSLNVQTGIISGIPRAVGSYRFSITATDGRGGAVTKGYTLLVPSAAVTLDANLAPGKVGDAYTGKVTAGGGTAPYSFALRSEPPVGLSLSSDGTISGTPTRAGTASFEVGVADRYGSRHTATLSLVIAPRIDVAPAQLSVGQTGQAYMQQLTASGSAGPFTFTASGLPDGLTLLTSGLLSGAPKSHGVTTVTITAKDSEGFTGTLTTELHVIPADLLILRDTLPGAVAGAAYSERVGGAGGVGPYAFGVTKGSLPAGLSLDSASGLISGSPTAVGEYAFTLTLADLGSVGVGEPGESGPLRSAVWAAAGDAVSVSRDFEITVASAELSLTASLPDGEVGTAYQGSITADGGTGPYSFALTGATPLPAGLALAADGTLSGTPGENGVFGFTVTVTDAYGSTGAGQFAVTVDPAPVVPTPTPSGTATPAPSGTATTAPSGTATTAPEASASPSNAGNGKPLANTGAGGTTTWLIIGGGIVVVGGAAALLAARGRKNH